MLLNTKAKGLINNKGSKCRQIAKHASPPKNVQEAENSKHQGNLLFQKQNTPPRANVYRGDSSIGANKHVVSQRAMANEKRLRWKEAKEDLEKCLKLDHDNVKATYHLGVCVCMQGEIII